MNQVNSPVAWMACMGAILFGFAGCDAQGSSAESSSQGQAPRENLIEQVQSVETTYGAIIRQGEKIGHTIEKVERLDHQDEAFVRTTSTESIQVQRAGQALHMQVENVFLETANGELRQFITKIDQAGAVTRFQGQVSADGRSLTVTTRSSATRQPVSEELPWSSNYGGIYAVKRLFEEPPLQAGQTRSVTAFIPTLNQAGKVVIKGLEKESTTLLDGASYELLKASYVTEIAGQAPLEAICWLDEAGDVVRMTSPVQEFEIYRCPREFALSENKAVSFDLAMDTIVPIQGDLPDRSLADSATYRLTLQGGAPGRVFASETSQRLEPGLGKTTKLHVYRVRVDQPLPDGFSGGEAPQPEDSAGSPLVQVDDPQVQRLARQVALTGSDRWQQAVALEGFVHRLIQQKDFSRGFLSAADVAEQKVGDCTEHAVLLMALLRAHGIPARGALGLVYVDHGDQPGFAYHMWTEAWIGDRWIPLDATRGEGGIDIGYIKVTQASLSGAGAFAAFLPVSQVIGQLQIEVIQ